MQPIHATNSPRRDNAMRAKVPFPLTRITFVTKMTLSDFLSVVALSWPETKTP